jgi:ribosomal protein S18 acetylase RimI-like enzyme
MQVRQAEVKDVEALLPLFNAYRQFYKRERSENKAADFIATNLENKRSIILLADAGNGKVVGFIQFYWRLSALSLAPYLYLADLYVGDVYRKQGVARKLMEQARLFGVEHGAVALQLETAHTNTPAQKLYESLGYQIEQAYRTYELSLPAP